MTTDLHELSGAYVLDAVDDIERAAFARHLAECAACTAEVAELRQVADLLGELAEQPPPPALRANVLAAVGRTRQAGPEEPVPGKVVQQTRARRTGRPMPGWLVAAVAAAAAAVLAIAGTWAVMDQRLQDQHRQVRALQADRARIYAVMNARDVQMLGTNLPGGGRVAAALSTVEQGGVAMLAGLARPPDGEVYQMWLMVGQRATSALVVPAGLRGGTMLFQHWIPGADAVGITFEPLGGSALPTMAPLATIKLS
jgi:anti-sigma factor RsiW